MNMSCAFSKRLRSLVGNHLEVSINDNKSTMLSVRWEGEKTKVSLHRIFLQAPDNVRKDLVEYLQRKKRKMPAAVKAFIQESISSLNYSHMLDPAALTPKGTVYNLEAIYKQLNKRYFDGALDLKITWYATSIPKNRSRCSLGLYYDVVKLIKVHRLLDSIFVPQYVIEFIVYHEMAHAACPAYVDEKGVHRIHSKEFKALEMQYEHYEQAEKWLKENQNCFFPTKKRVLWPGTANGQISSIKKTEPTQKKAKSLPGFLRKLSMP